MCAKKLSSSYNRTLHRYRTLAGTGTKKLAKCSYQLLLMIPFLRLPVYFAYSKYVLAPNRLKLRTTGNLIGNWSTVVAVP